MGLFFRDNLESYCKPLPARSRAVVRSSRYKVTVTRMRSRYFSGVLERSQVFARHGRRYTGAVGKLCGGRKIVGTADDLVDSFEASRLLGKCMSHNAKTVSESVEQNIIIGKSISRKYKFS